MFHNNWSKEMRSNLLTQICLENSHKMEEDKVHPVSWTFDLAFRFSKDPGCLNFELFFFKFLL